MRRRVKVAGVVAAIVLGCAAFVSGSAPAVDSGAPWGPIRSHQNWRCLDADLGTIGPNGTKVQLWGCNGWDNQSWSYDVSSHTIHSRENGRCLDADLGTVNANGTKVQLWDCNGWTNQKWIYDAVSHTIYSMHNGKCLDADLTTVNANGTKVQLWNCNGWANQKWTL
ncbi:RICIN domain-containing protein [Streptosporangium sp. DT93]|uniref:RICIN domain-containing protein n=1 Tax=Streptosporangium sp. DT93 TaxID=3393428 RepID=UPI003CE90E1C